MGPSFLARFAAFVAMMVGTFVLAGWALDMDQITNLAPGWPRMVKLTAVCFVLIGAALWAITLRARVPAMMLAALVALVSLTILIGYAAHWDVHLDQLTLAAIPPSSDGEPTARMVPATAVGLLLLGLSLLLALLPRTARLHQA